MQSSVDQMSKRQNWAIKCSSGLDVREMDLSDAGVEVMTYSRMD